MLNVKTPEEVMDLIGTAFSEIGGNETVSIADSAGRTLSQDITASEYVPDFNRSTVDGYAVRAVDTFGCSDSIPAILEYRGQVLMGEQALQEVTPGTCVAVPTGGDIPEGADGVVMIEYTEDYGDGTIGILKPSVPGANMIYRGDDVTPGKVVLQKGRILGVQDVGALAAMGVVSVPVKTPLRVGIISTGDELIPPEDAPKAGQIRDVNTSLLTVSVKAAGAVPVIYGIVGDEYELLEQTLNRASEECDMVLVSGGSSVGAKDATSRVIENNGELLMHGIAMKPGKPTILGKISGVPVWGLPGHPVAAMFIMKLFVVPMMDRLSGSIREHYPVTAVLDQEVGANHGRAQYMGVVLRQEQGVYHASPIRSKSGLITSLAESAGYFCIDRDCEGLPAGSAIKVYSF